ncbi:MAG: 50S ribosomal protein L18 [Brevinematales bacterium]|nr:50S ribosomal protein L18 [Brevinematales bacterium]
MIDITKKKAVRRTKAKKRTRFSVVASSDRPRLLVHRSNKYLYAQLVDKDGKILCSVSSISKELREKKLTNNIESAKIMGAFLGDKLKEMKIEKICFDRNGFLYHGKIKALADALREAGIKF